MIVFLGLLLVAYVVVIKLVIPQELPRELSSRIEKACATCSLQIRSLKTDLLNPGHLRFTDVRLKAGRNQTTAVHAHVAELDLSMSLLALMHRRLIVNQLNLEAPFVELIDGSQHTPPSPSPPVIQLPFQFDVESTTVANGVFRYVGNSPKMGVSRLQFSHISGQSDRISNEPPYLRGLTHSILKGVNTSLRQSGREPGETVADAENSERTDGPKTISLDVRANYLVQPTRAEVQLIANHQSLGPMGEFLKKNDGIRLSGQIENGLGKVKVDGKSIWAELTSRYRGLKVGIEPTAKRSQLSAAVMNLGAELLVQEKTRANSNKPNETGAGKVTDAFPARPTIGTPAAPSAASSSPAGEKIEKIYTQKQESETVVHAIIRALKEVSIKSAAKTS